ncbi:phage shock protein operon transcriptional activator [Rhodospirillum rubrum]|uniref:phage shock protein operon transcriptional activator n=1 Tax=Rhodospirillum rubrum TaxID=1085 RepID=UPI00190847E3|nr:phage shock protein operon transcriptional activator [Rhodospirillum rubrum]MBK1665643.1 phage shock protein operon transcriptional activator [Rhodospirillum rubrum]MBK1678473.1 phage shock protein operon transcriptional activator [Rhodospirillum rubrum]
MDMLPPIIGEDPAFLDVIEQASRLAPIDRPCLVVGERGTGKELVAARLHYLSRRWQGPLVKVNCAALSETLLESELFGHEAGAFTGAQRRHLGRFERAEGGTLILDEIANASQAVQEKVLRVIEYGELERVGGAATLRVDVRVIGVANVDLPKRAAEGGFRADLLDRLAFDVLTLPPLRARPGDILALAEAFARAMAGELERPAPAFSPAARAQLLGHGWPGNVRELRNASERAVARLPREAKVIETVVIDPFASPWCLASALAALPAVPSPADGASPPEGQPFAAAVAAYEQGLLRRALAAAEGNQGKAAQALSLGYHQFRRLLARHGLGPGAGG